VTAAIDNGTVLLLIALAVLPIAAISFARSGRAWRGIGKGPFAIEREDPVSPRGEDRSAAEERAVQEVEARQMLEAKSYRRRREGGEPIDVEAEIALLLGSSDEGAAKSGDEGLRAEVRELVIAANERRQRSGLEPLDVEAETERRLAELTE
jgi:hypothetical protein